MATQPDLRVWLGCIFTRRGRYGKRERCGALQNAFSREESIRQVSSPVRWQQSVEKLIAAGVDTFVEIGPGMTLSGFIRRIDRNVKCFNVGTWEEAEKAAEEAARRAAEEAARKAAEEAAQKLTNLLRR